MRRRAAPAVHPIGCTCNACRPSGQNGRRLGLAIKCATRALLLIAILFAIPFIIARFVASIKEDRR